MFPIVCLFNSYAWFFHWIEQPKNKKKCRPTSVESLFFGIFLAHRVPTETTKFP